MYGSRKYTGTGGHGESSLEALNRTIEGLEARLQGLLGEERRRQAAPRDQGGDPLAAIRARQDLLDRRRSAEDRARPPVAAGSEPFPARPADSRPPRDGRRDDDIKGIAEMLAEMRRELKAEIRAGFSGELDQLRRDIRDLAADSRDAGLPEDLRRDFAQIAASIERLDDGYGNVDALRLELDSIRSMIDGLAREDSVRALESRWQSVEDQVAGLDINGMRQELVNLAYRVDDVREALAGMPRTGASDRLEAQIGQLSGIIEGLAAGPDLAAGDLSAHFQSIDSRLDEISRAVAALQKSPRAFDPAPIERLEARMGAIARKLDAIDSFDPASDFAGRIDAVASRVSELADEEAIGRLETRLAQLQITLEAALSGESRAAAAGLTDTIADLSGKIERIGALDIGRQLASRLDDLAARIDAIGQSDAQPAALPESVIGRLESLIGRAETSIRNPDPLPGIETLEARLGDIVARLDEAADARTGRDIAPLAEFGSLESRLADISDKLDRAGSPMAGAGEDLLKSLESQIAGLSRQIAQSAGAVAPAELDTRLSAIEEHLATNDEYVIEAARQAAEAALGAYAGQAGGGLPSASMDVIAALADDLKALENLSRQSEARTSRAFEAVQDTLLKIAGRLEKLDEMSRAAPPSAPVMPRAAELDVKAAPEAGPSRETVETGQAPTEEAPRRDRRRGRDGRTPAEAAALAAAYAAESATEQEAADEAADEGKSERSFLAGLTSRIRPRKDAVAEPAEPRFAETDTPPLDPSMELDRDTANMPLEPGSGAPDINRILQKVRQAQAAEARRSEDGGPGAADKADFLASARRAAMAAAAEVETLGKQGRKKGGPGGMAAFLKARRKPILLAVGAVLLVVMSLPLVGGLLDGSGDAPVPVADLPAAVEPAPDAPALAGNAPSAPQPVTASAALNAEAGGNGPAEAGATEASTAQAALPPVRLVDSNADAQEPAATETAAAQIADPHPETIAGPRSEAADTALSAEIGDLPPGVLSPALKLAALEGDPIAFYEIGARFTEGRGAAVDLARAAAWYRRAADLGHAPSQYRLANFYEKGSGLERDIEQAKKWYQLAAEQGNASAMHNLAVLYATAGAAPDYESAAEWFRKAADLGVRDSQVNLAILHARGDGVPRDLEQSYKWFAVAANDGDKDAAAKRDEVYNALRPEQAQAARALVAAWKPQPLAREANTVDVPAGWGGSDTSTASVDMSKAIRNIQAILNKNGFDAGKPDGVMGARTVAAIKAFQQAEGLEATGEVTDELVRRLLARNK